MYIKDGELHRPLLYLEKRCDCLSDENKKETDKIIDNLATTIVDNIQSITDTCIKKAKYDKSFNTTVLGVNQNFSDKVPEDKQKELIEKFKIPDEYSSPAYYTFMINGEYYVKASKNEYYLYDEICVRVPNGSWDNMYIEINLPRDKESNSNSCLFKRGDGDNSIVAINESLENTATGESSYCGGRGNSSGGAMSFIGGGMNNSSADATAPTICGGGNNKIEGVSYAPTICGGGNNKITGNYVEFIGGGSGNKIISSYAGTICGGVSNTLNGTNNAYAFIGGGNGNKIDNAPYGAIIGNQQNTIENTNSCNMICGGYKNTISGANTSYSIIAHGKQNKINGGNHSGIFTGWKNVISDGAYYSAILNGEGCLCNSERQAVMGRYNISSSDGYSYSSYLVVGNGSGDSSRSNAFRVDAAGNIYAETSVNSAGADFAEMREWSDGNSDNEDRRGLFVVYDDSLDYAVGEYAKIRIANANDDLDDIVGIVSSNPTIVGNTASEIWQGMYLRDIFGNNSTGYHSCCNRGS